MNTFQAELVVLINLMNSDAGLMILPAEIIVYLVCSVTNWKTDTSTHYLLAAPQQRWRELFSERIKDHSHGENLRERIEAINMGDEEKSTHNAVEYLGSGHIEIKDTSDDSDASSTDGS